MAMRDADEQGCARQSRHAAGARQVAGEELTLPAARHIDREARAVLTVCLGLRAVEGVTVDRRGAGVEPQFRRVCSAGDGLAQQSCRGHARAQDLLAVRVGVAAAHALAGQVHHQGGAVDEAGEGCAVAPPTIRAITPHASNVVSARGEIVDETATD